MRFGWKKGRCCRAEEVDGVPRAAGLLLVRVALKETYRGFHGKNHGLGV